MMDKRRSVLNVGVSIVSRILLLISALIVRRLLIRHIGNDVNGLNSLYTSIIGVLSVAELGIGSAIVYSMYKPIVEGNKRQVAALYCLYKRLYRIVGVVIFFAGLLVLPLLPRLIGDYERLNVDVYLTFFLLLISVVLTYLYGAKTSLIMAYKDDYITTGIMTIGHLIGYALQSLSILLFRSFALFLGCHIIETCLIWGMTEFIVRKRHGEIISRREEIDGEMKQEISRNVKALFMHNIGDVLVNGVDSTIISAFIGVAILGKYSNYTLIAGVVSGIIALVFSPLTSVIGHMCVGHDKGKIKETYQFFYCLNYVLAVIFFLGYYAVIDSVIQLLFGVGMEVSKSVSFVITLNEFTKFLRRATLLFRNASGVFYFDRWKPLVEGIANLILSLVFVLIFPEELKVVGVIVATIITTLLICDIVEPYVVFKHVFGESVERFCLRNYLLTGLFAGALFSLTYLLRQAGSAVMGILINGLISVALSIFLLALVSIIDRTFRREICLMVGDVSKGVRRCFGREEEGRRTV